MSDVIRERFVWLLFLSNFTINAMMYGMINWMPSYLIQSVKLSTIVQGHITAMPLDQRTLAQGILISASGISGIIVPLVVSPVLQDYGWQRAFWMIAIASVVVGIVLRFVLPSEKKFAEVPAGLLNTKLGSKRLLVFSMAAIAIFAAMAGFAKAVLFIIIIRFLAGAIAHSGYAPSAAKEVATKLAAPAKAKVTARTITLVAALFLGFIMIYFDKNAICIILVSMQQDFGFSNVQKGMVMSAFFIGYASMRN
ncbi:hypothetical protein H7R52_18625 [Weissella confusa]|uniref:Major facilitator superfamily (MFS) profile domain-containing protein n=1 Tax=Weissella confusa TaxID=1583 RepID=A0A923SP31_WEICO|nr:hypothetical protein [Weissella confusa]